MTRFLLLIALLAWSVRAFELSAYDTTGIAPVYVMQQTQYRVVDCTNGNDGTGDGTFSAPFKTIAHAVGSVTGQNQIYIKNGPCTESTITLTNNFDYRGLDAGRVYITNGFTYTPSSSTNGQIGLFNLEIPTISFSNVGSGGTPLLVMNCKIDDGSITNSAVGGFAPAYFYYSDVTLSTASGDSDNGWLNFINCISGGIDTVTTGTTIVWKEGVYSGSTTLGDDVYFYAIAGDFTGASFTGTGTGFDIPLFFHGPSTKGSVTLTGVANVYHQDDYHVRQMSGTGTISGTTASVTFHTPSITEYTPDVTGTSSACSANMYVTGATGTGYTVHGTNGCPFAWQMEKND